MPRVGKQFEQLPLFFKSESGIEGSPATQSPEQFRDDPQTVFHASYVKIPRSLARGQQHGRDFPGIHAGTYQAAAERSLSFGRPFHSMDPDQRADGREYSHDVDNAKIVFHRLSLRDSPLPAKGPGSVDELLADDEANDEGRLRYSDRPLAYENTAEDVGSASVVFPNHAVPKRLHQSDWVEEAARNNSAAGRRPDYGIHPRTWAMYKGMNLDNHDQKTFDEVAAELRPNDRSEERGGGLFPYVMRRENPNYDMTSMTNHGKPHIERYASREEVAEHAQTMLHRIQFNPEADREIWGGKRDRLTAFAKNPYNDIENNDGSLFADGHRQNNIDAINRIRSDMKMYGMPPSKEQPSLHWNNRNYDRPYGDLGDPRRGKQFGGSNA